MELARILSGPPPRDSPAPVFSSFVVPGVTCRRADRTSETNGDYIMHEGKDRIVLAEISRITIGRNIERATSGWINSDAVPGIRMSAMSGWTQEASHGDHLLDSEDYTARVFKTAALLKVHLPSHRWDNGWKPALPHQQGRFNACHIVCAS